MSLDPNDDVVRLATAPNPAQAHIWCQALKDAGVRCKVVGDYLGAGLGDIPGMRAEIWVHSDDVKNGEDVLRKMQEAEVSDEGEEEGEEEDEP
jgi:hypothetical protein